MLKAHPEAWNVNTVIGTLSALINKSKIVQTLENEKKGEPYVRIDLRLPTKLISLFIVPMIPKTLTLTLCTKCLDTSALSACSALTACWATNILCLIIIIIILIMWWCTQFIGWWIISYLALKTLEPLDIAKKGLHTRVTACHITLYYYLGFSYLMMRRYLLLLMSHLRYFWLDVNTPMLSKHFPPFYCTSTGPSNTTHDLTNMMK